MDVRSIQVREVLQTFSQVSAWSRGLTASRRQSRVFETSDTSQPTNTPPRLSNISTSPMGSSSLPALLPSHLKTLTSQSHSSSAATFSTSPAPTLRIARSSTTLKLRNSFYLSLVLCQARSYGWVQRRALSNVWPSKIGRASCRERVF